MKIPSNNSFFLSQIQENIKEKILDLKNKPNNIINLSEVDELNKEKKYDLIISTCQNYQENLKHAKNLLNPNTPLIAGFINNISFENEEHKFNTLVNTTLLPKTDMGKIETFIKQEKYYMPIIEKDYITIQYKNPHNLIIDLKESGLLYNDPNYIEQFISFKNETIIMILEVIYLIAWRP